MGEAKRLELSNKANRTVEIEYFIM